MCGLWQQQLISCFSTYYHVGPQSPLKQSLFLWLVPVYLCNSWDPNIVDIAAEMDLINFPQLSLKSSMILTQQIKFVWIIWSDFVSSLGEFALCKGFKN